MDPASAIIGLAASLTTLVGLVLESAKVLYKAQGHFKDAPQDIRRLCRQMNEFERLLHAVHAQTDTDCSPAAAAIRSVIAASVQHMNDDLQDFIRDVKKLKDVLDTSGSEKKLIRFRLRHIFTESKTARYQGLISSYTATLNLHLAMAANAKLDYLVKQRTSALANNVHSHSRTSRARCCARQTPAAVRTQEFQFPLGITALLSTSRPCKSNDREDNSSALIYHIKFIPPQWIASSVLLWAFTIGQNRNYFTGLNVSLSPIRYNSNPLLVKAVKSCDWVQLQKLFHDGTARPDDYLLLRRRPMRLLEVIAPRSFSCDSDDVLCTYKYLVSQTSEKDVSNLAWSHSRILINLAKHSTERLNSALATFCSQSGSVFWAPSMETPWEATSSETSKSILSLIIRHGAGFSSLETCIFRQSEPWTVEDLTDIDRWLIGALSSVSPSFRNSLQQYLQSYKCVFGTSKAGETLFEPFEIHHIVPEVAQASGKTRIEFLKILVKWGTKHMLKPFLSAGFVDLEETVANAMFPWLRLSYLGKAAKWGNRDTFEYLLDLGACPILGLNYMSRFPSVIAQGAEDSQEEIKSMAIKMMEKALSDHNGCICGGLDNMDHDMVLALLLRTSHLQQYNRLKPDELIDQCLDSRVDHTSHASDAVYKRYIVVLLALDLPNSLRKLLRQRATHYTARLCPFQPIDVDFEDSSVAVKSHPPLPTVSWISLAAELGKADCLKALLEGYSLLASKSSEQGCTQELDTSTTETYLQFIRILQQCLAKIQAHEDGHYPRQAMELHTWPCQIPKHIIAQSEDQRIAAMLEEFIRKLEGTLSTVNPSSVSGYVSPFNSSTSSRKNRLDKQLNHRQAANPGVTALLFKLFQLRGWEIVLLVVSYIMSATLMVFRFGWSESGSGS